MLLSKTQDLERDRFDEFVSRNLLEIAFGCEMLDVEGAKEAAAKTLGRGLG